MPITVLDRPTSPCNVPKVAEAQSNPPPEGRAQDDEPDAREMLDGWIVQISSRLINTDLGAVIVLAVATAWQHRRVPGLPPGGWPRLGGTTTRNWHRWRERAISLGLVEMRGSRIVPLAHLEPGEQFARVQIAILCDPKLPRTAKRTYLSLALFGSDLGHSRASLRTLARASGIDQRNIRKGLRQLENRCHIVRRGETGMGVQRYFLPAAPDSGTESYAPNPPNGQKRPPYHGSEPDKNAPPNRSEPDKNAPPNRTKTPPLLQEYKNLSLQERRKAQAPVESPAPCAEQPPPTKTQAKTIIRRFGLTAPGADFGKPANNSGPQGRKPVVEPPPKQRWRPLRHGQILEKNWAAETERLCSTGLFRPAVNDAVPQLKRRKEAAN